MYTLQATVEVTLEILGNKISEVSGPGRYV